MHGFCNRLLKVDLSARTWTTEGIPDDVLIRYLGGKVFAGYAPISKQGWGAESPIVHAQDIEPTPEGVGFRCRQCGFTPQALLLCEGISL